MFFSKISRCEDNHPSESDIHQGICEPKLVGRKEINLVQQRIYPQQGNNDQQHKFYDIIQSIEYLRKFRKLVKHIFLEKFPKHR